MYTTIWCVCVVHVGVGVQCICAHAYESLSPSLETSTPSLSSLLLTADYRLLTYLDAVLIVREDVGGRLVGAQCGAPRAVAQQLAHPLDLGAEHLGK